MANQFEIKKNQKISLPELIKILEEHRSSIIINLKHLQENYERKCIKRVQACRDENGKILQPWLSTEDIDKSEYVDMGTFEMNRNSATINMLITHRIKLVKAEDATPLIEVAGLLVNDLTSFHNYTIVSDGRVNVKSLQVKISSKKTFELLKQKDVIEAEQFDFRREYTIKLDNLPLVPFEQHYGSIDGLFNQLAEIKVLSSIISAHLKEESDIFVSEQLAELKKHYLSKHIYINFPTINEYTDLKEALANGTVDSRISNKIEIGSKEILNLGKLYSANKFLDRMYRIYEQETGEIFQKPTFKLAFHENIAFRHKLLSSRMKITKVDEFMKPIFDDFLGLENNGIVASILTKVGAESLVQVLQKRRDGESVSKEELIAALFAANTKLKEFAEKIYRDRVCPLVFYIGSTGVLPDELHAKAMSSEEVSAKYPHLQLSKNEQKGTFFAIGDSMISVYSKTAYYSKCVTQEI